MKTFFRIMLMLFLAWGSTSHVYASPKVTQTALIEFQHQLVTVLAVEEFEKVPVLQFYGENDKLIASFPFDGEETGDFVPISEFLCGNPFLRFRQFKISGLPSPFILAIAARPGGSDWGFDGKIITGKNGKLTSVNPAPLTMNILDGLYLGYINAQYGHGLITWKFLWDDGVHYDPHKYTIRIYSWNQSKQQFVFAKELISSKKYEDACGALQEYKLPCQNFRDMVVTPEEECSTLGIEDAILRSHDKK